MPAFKSTTSVESSHRELCSRFSHALRCNGATRVTNCSYLPRCRKILTFKSAFQTERGREVARSCLPCLSTQRFSIHFQSSHMFTHVHTSSTSNHHPNPPNPPAHHSTWRKSHCVAGRLEVIESTRLGPAKCIQMPHFLLSRSTTFDRSVSLLASKNFSVAMNVPTSIPSASHSFHFCSISWASAAVRRCLGVS